MEEKWVKTKITRMYKKTKKIIMGKNRILTKQTNQVGKATAG